MKRLLLPLLLAPVLAVAQQVSAGALAQLTKGGDTARGTAYGFVVGVLEASPFSLGCVPPDTDVFALVEKLTRGIEQAPKGISAAGWIQAQARLLFPCK